MLTSRGSRPVHRGRRSRREPARTFEARYQRSEAPARVRQRLASLGADAVGVVWKRGPTERARTRRPPSTRASHSNVGIGCQLPRHVRL